MSEKINFAWPVTSENSVVFQYFVTRIHEIKEQLYGKKIIIFGAGIRGCCILYLLEQQGFKDIIFCDNNPEKQGNLINSYDIFSLNEALQFKETGIFLVSPENSEKMNLQLIQSGLHEKDNWFSFDISVYEAYIAEYRRAADHHLLVMSDCAFSHISLIDESSNSLGDMLKEELGEEHCKVLAMHGIGQQADYHILRALLDNGEQPSLVLLLVMETLTPKAHLMPRTQHPALIKRLADECENTRAELVEYAKLAKERYEQFQVESFASFRPGAEGSISEKMFMKMNYLFKIKEETEGVIYLKKTIKMLNDTQIPVVLYIPPVNYMQGEQFFGSCFKSEYMKNFTKLYEFLDREHLSYGIADASFLLSDKEFAATNTIDEITNFTGRKKILDFFKEHEQLCQLFH